MTLLFKNETKSIEIAQHVKKADTYLKRLVGLLGHKQLAPGEGLWIIPCKDIHSIGMRFRFDALFLDDNLVVVHMVESMKPWRISKYVKEARTVLEIDAGIIATTGTQVGDQLSTQAL